MDAASRPKRPRQEFKTPDKNQGERKGIADAKVEIFNDPIHGFIQLHPVLVKIIHTPQFERLKDIKQLGVCYWVYPGASHNRFEHCLGTAYLCGKLIDKLRKQHQNEIEITKEEALCIKIAGLCHDLGHGPFSHFFDGVFIPRAKPNSKWQHEQASCDLFDFMLQSNPSVGAGFQEYGLGKEEIDFIKELIMGKDPQKDEVTRICPRTRKPKWFLYEIVSNKRSGIDCDKFDYFARDCANVGVKSNFDCRRYFQNVRILLVDEQLQLCVRDKEVFNLYELFHTRWSLHHRVYKHKTQAPIEDLLVQAFLKVDEVCHISESIQDMERYTDLTDSVMYDILRKESTESNVVEAKELLRRIQRRDLYKFCGQTQPESEVKRKADPQTQPGSEVKCGKADTQTQPGSEVEWKADKIAQELASLSKSALKAEQVFVSIVNIHFGMKDKDPVDAVVFYNKSYQPHEVTKEQVSQMLPQKFRERYVRVYAKSREDSELIQQCFKEWCSDNGYPVPVPHMLEGDPSTGYKTTGKSEPASTNASDPADEGAGKSSDKVARALEPEFDEIIDLA